LGAIIVSCLVLGCQHSGSSGGGGSSVAAIQTGTTQTTSTNTTPTGRIEYVEFQAMDVLPATKMMSTLNQTVGATVGNAAQSLPLRNGFYLTATPQGSNVVLEVDADGGGVRPRAAYAAVAIPSDLAGAFIQFAQVAMATASLTSQTPGLAAPWNIYLHAESATGGKIHVDVSGDANANFTLSWTVDSPVRAIDAFAAPTPWTGTNDTTAIAKVGGTVHFPIDLPTFKFFVNQAYGYGAPQRFNDFALIPHTWLHLTVTADSTGRVVNVHFDAITTSGARLFVAEAPASTDVGGRFFDETVSRMTEMNAEEAALPGSSKPWGTSFYYADPSKGVVDVVVKGTVGAFDIAYAVETPVFQVKP
jgi:hypothetical protein